MQKNRDVLRQVGGLAVALLVCIAVMLAVYALLGRLDRRKRSWRSRHPAWCARWCWR